MKLKTGFSDLTADQVVNLGDSVKAAMTGKPIWSGMTALLTQLPLDIQALRDALAATGPGASQLVEAADLKASNTLGDIADAANKTPNVTDAELAGTTLPQVKERQAQTQVPPAPEDLRPRHGPMPGDVDASVNPIPGGNIRTYEGQWSLNPDSGYSETATFPNSRAIHFPGLPRGKDVWLRVRARNTIGAGPWSDPATIMVT